MSYSLCAIRHTVCSATWIIDKLLLFADATVAATCLDHCKLTVDSEALWGSLGTDRVAGSARVLPSITPPGWVNNQRATGDGDPGVGSDGRAAFAPLDCNLCPSSPCTPQRYISSLHRYRGNRQADPGHCIYRERKKKYFIKEQQIQNYPEKVSDGTITVGIGHTAHESAHFKSWSDNTIQGSFMFLLRIICCNQSK